MKNTNCKKSTVNNHSIPKRTERNKANKFLSYTSYDCEAKEEIDLKPRNRNGLRHDSPSARFRDPNNGQWDLQIYLPEGFDWNNCPVSSENKTSAKWVVHQLHLRRFVNEDHRVYEKDDYVPLNYDVAYALDRRFPATIRELLNEDILQRDYFIKGEKSYGYRFVSQRFRNATRRLCPLGDPAFAKKLRKQQEKHCSTRTDRWLRRQLMQIGLADIDEDFLKSVGAMAVRKHGGTVEAKLEAYQFVLDRIARGDHYYSSDSQGRHYTTITNLKRELRRFLRVADQPLCELDLKNSQLLFLALEMRRDAIDDPAFLDVCAKGMLYETIAKQAHTTRDEVKAALTQRALFSENDARCQRSKIMRAFQTVFPKAADYVFQIKNCEHGGSALAKRLQRAEADLVINKVCGRLRREGQVGFVTPIHDCLLFLAESGDYVRKTMASEFATLGVTPTLDIRTL